MHWLRVFVSIVLGGFGLLAVSASAQATGDLPIEIVPPTQHTQGVNSVVFSNGDDDRFIASSGEDGVIKLWDVRTGRLIRNVVRIDLNNKYWRVNSLSSDGRLLFGVVADQYKVWSTLTGKELASIATGGGDHDEDIIYISHDGSRLATPRADKTIKLFDAQNGKEVATLKNALDLAFSADGKRAVVATYDKKIELWDAVTGTRIDTLATSDEMLKRVSYTPSGRRIASKSTSGLIKLWDAGNKRQITEVPGNEQSKSLFSPDGAYWAVQDGMGTVKILNSETGATYSSFKAPEKTSILQFSLDNRILIFEPDASAGGQAPEWTFLSFGKLLYRRGRRLRQRCSRERHLPRDSLLCRERQRNPAPAGSGKRRRRANIHGSAPLERQRFFRSRFSHRACGLRQTDSLGCRHRPTERGVPSVLRGDQRFGSFSRCPTTSVRW